MVQRRRNKNLILVLSYRSIRKSELLNLVTNLVDCQPEVVYIRMPLEVVFQRVNDKLTIPLFKPIEDTPS